MAAFIAEGTEELAQSDASHETSWTRCRTSNCRYVNLSIILLQRRKKNQITPKQSFLMVHSDRKPYMDGKMSCRDCADHFMASKAKKHSLSEASYKIRGQVFESHSLQSSCCLLRFYHISKISEFVL